MQLEREAFGERAREHPSRLEALHAHEHALDAFDGGAEPVGDLGDRAVEVSGLVQAVDQRCADNALGRISEEDRGLTLKMVAQAEGLGDIGFEVGGFAGVRADAEARPGVGAQAVGWGGLERRRSAVRVEGVVDLGAEIGGEAPGVRLERLARPVAGLGWRIRDARAVLRLGVWILALLRTLEQRIARQFVLDELGQLEVGHLQQLDRLQQLRRQNHSLTLPHRQFGRERHTYRKPFTAHPHKPAIDAAARFLL